MFGFQSLKSFKNRRIQLASKQDIEPHEIILDSLAEKQEKEFGFSGRKLEVPLMQKIIKGFYLFCFFILLILFCKTFQLQVIEGKDFTQLADKNKFIIHQIQAERGVIYDRNFEQLVFNKSTFNLVCQKAELPESEAEKKKVFREVAGILKKDVGELEKEIEESESDQVLVAANLSHEELILFEAKIGALTGFEIGSNVVREYKDSEVFAHLLGYTGRIQSEELEGTSEFYLVNDYVGRTGVESFYESDLRKNPGELRIKRDVLGNAISEETVSLPESGNSLVLWLDAELQRKITAELENILQNTGTKKAVAIALDPRNGGVLSLVSLPSFDSNLFQKGADEKALQALLNDSQKLNPLFNRAISGRYLTGSTIKPLIASAALKEGIIDPDKEINCHGQIEIPNPWDPGNPTIKKDNAIHSWTNMRKAIAESCNVYFYTVGGGYEKQDGLGPTKIKEYLELFGWDEKTGIDVPGEIAGFIPDQTWKKEKIGEAWWDGDTYNLAIGQGYIQITPLEVVTAFGAIANGGILYQPQVAKEIIDGSGQLVEQFSPEVIRQNFIDSQYLQIVREGMRQAVTGENSPQASSVLLNSLPVAVAAKTGTAELGKDHYNNWVTVFAPYDNPEIVLTVMIEDVIGVQAAALPVARAVLEWYFTQEQE
ncbi:MAG: penicillin-binding protein 2 [Candidatus Nealsonbacteria bacterium RBG_13_38_11]|uniref:Penicillin-binding protein 2 n=1 Tax=Candidatus Nealsonbacteria bacterium RBG_13_38_11 TaxID=1801662 RepID=A0A1G2DZB7_9BACT|nr:MAG: penicillin-binding protein 2 [Candidatus Nealsonbacteria bacterium RBG_13_38_11]HXK32100.1 penicillin-binding protein 2 [Candidatus Paceibacterota bacterium]